MTLIGTLPGSYVWWVEKQNINLITALITTPFISISILTAYYLWKIIYSNLFVKKLWLGIEILCQHAQFKNKGFFL